MSAIICTLRLLIATDIPMNQGVLAPITIHTPPGTVINPTADAAVSTDNALTSQRLVDVILKAFEASAGSQGCMGCTSMFGGPREDGGFDYAYGETICSGNGAGLSCCGSEIPTQVHMTNTRGKDVEVLEKRYPLIVREFSVRHGSGGEGLHRGGNGAKRVFEAREPLYFSFMSERRTIPPYGLAGGDPGERGLNLRVKKSTAGGFITVNLGPRSSFVLQPGEQFVINTPGGGGWGKEGTIAAAIPKSENKVTYGRATGSVTAFKELHDGQ
jgi:5-oxoprolinase (ATP-hydrolysing)